MTASAFALAMRDEAASPPGGVEGSRGSGLQGGQALSDSVLGQTGHVVDVELFHDGATVGLHGLDADVELGGDVLGARSLGDELEHLSFPAAQGIGVLLIGDLKTVDVVFQDVATDDQSEILIRNCKAFLKPGGTALLSLKSRSIDVTKSPDVIYKQEEKKLKTYFKVVEKVRLDPYEKDHMFFVLKPME